jgi:isopropylmalate/homocitrate/citramalate synthase
MHLDEIFTPEEQAAARAALAEHRPAGAYEAGKWMVHPLNRSLGTGPGHFPPKVVLRDITLRTMEQMPGVSNTLEERLVLVRALAEAGVREIVMSMFRRGHDRLDDLRQEVATAKAVSPDCEIVYDNAVKSQELELAVAAGIGRISVLSAVYLGKAMPVSAGAVYHRVWQGRDWRDLRFPTSLDQHLDRSRRLIRAGVDLGLKMIGTVNLLAYASEDYIAKFSAAVAEAGAHEIMLADSSGGTGPEAMARLVEVAKANAPGLRIGVHCHNIYGFAIANSVASLRAGAEVVEVSINGYEVGPAGCQASLAGTAMALEALYGIHTGIELSRLAPLTQLAAELAAIPTTWNEPVLGSGTLQHSAADEYEQEEKFDRLIHGSLVLETVGAHPRRRLGVISGPLNTWDKLEALGIVVTREQVEPIRAACMIDMRLKKRALEDDEIRAVAKRVLSADPAAVS